MAKAIDTAPPYKTIAEVMSRVIKDDITSAEHTPGEVIVNTHCPCCGAALSVEYGDEGEIGVVGTPSPKFQRDPDAECVDYDPGEPTYGLCESDGYYMCPSCKNFKPAEPSGNER